MNELQCLGVAGVNVRHTNGTGARGAAGAGTAAPGQHAQPELTGLTGLASTGQICSRDTSYLSAANYPQHINTWNRRHSQQR